MRIFISGGGGFVGRHFREALMMDLPSAEIMMLHRPGRAREKSNSVTAAADIADLDKIDSIIADFKPDVIFHLAAQASPGLSAVAPAETWRINAVGTLALARAAANHVPMVSFFNISSAEVYGASFLAGKVDEEAPLKPRNVYANSKACAETIASDILPASARLVTLRPFNHCGPGQDERFVLPAFANQIARIEAGLQDPVLNVGNLDAEREFLDVRDVAEAYVLLLRSLQRLPMRSVFNIASGKTYKVGELLELMRTFAHVAFEIRIDPLRLRPAEIPRASGSAARLESLTGWAPKRRLESLIADIMEDARARVRERAAAATL